ncbi:hypothetical protein H696_01214, partial [Fonticula alba]
SESTQSRSRFCRRSQPNLALRVRASVQRPPLSLTRAGHLCSTGFLPAARRRRRLSTPDAPAVAAATTTTTSLAAAAAATPRRTAYAVTLSRRARRLSSVASLS